MIIRVEPEEKLSSCIKYSFKYLKYFYLILKMIKIILFTKELIKHSIMLIENKVNPHYELYKNI